MNWFKLRHKSPSFISKKEFLSLLAKLNLFRASTVNFNSSQTFGIPLKHMFPRYQFFGEFYIQIFSNLFRLFKPNNLKSVEYIMSAYSKTCKQLRKIGALTDWEQILTTKPNCIFTINVYYSSQKVLSGRRVLLLRLPFIFSLHIY